MSTSVDTSEAIYGHHDSDYEQYGQQFALHMDRMTVEQLDGKAEIAWELAYRDSQVAQLRSALTARDELLRECADVLEDGLETVGAYEPGWSHMDRQLAERIRAICPKETP